MNKFAETIRARVEFFLVLGAAFGLPIIVSLLRGFGMQQQKAATDYNLLALGCYELVIGAILLSFLWFRGWTPQKIGLSPTFKDTGIGLLLLAVTTILWIATFWATDLISPSTVAHMRETYEQLKGPARSVPTVVGVSLINAAFEEIFVSGYVVTALKPLRGPTFAVNVSVAIRLLYHLYQGQMAVLGVLPLGLVYASWYARTGRLWPLFVAHAIQDVASLMY